MPMQKVLMLTAILLIAFLAAISHKASATASLQGGSGKAAKDVSDKDKDKEARAINVSVAPINYFGKVIQTFKVGQPVTVGVWMTNTSNETLAIAKGDSYFYSRLKLIKDGNPVKYRAGVPRQIKSADDYGPGGLRVITIELPPNERTGVDVLDLRKWYDPLEPGKYELTVRHRFKHKGAEKQADTVTFEVAP